MFRTLRPAQLVFDVSLAAVYALFALAFELSYAIAPREAIGGAGVALLLTAALVVRRLSPGLALGVAWAAAVLQMALLLGPRPTDVAIFAVLYVTAAYGSRLVYWLGFASAVGGAVVITVYLFAVLNVLAWDVVTTLVLVLAAALFALMLSWVTGALVRTALRARENRRAQEVAQEEAAVEQERVRIARDMHDVVAHSLAVVIAQADGARYAAASDPDAASAALSTIGTTARAALADVRLLLTQLRHNQGDGPQPTLADVEALYAQVRAAGVELEVDVDPVPPGEPPAAVQLAVYRILQEALTNALRHGAAGAVRVRLAWLADRVELSLRNRRDGAAAPPAATGHGLIGMRERAQLAGGRFSAAPDGEDWVVEATLPIGGAA